MGNINLPHDAHVFDFQSVDRAGREGTVFGTYVVLGFENQFEALYRLRQLFPEGRISVLEDSALKKEIHLSFVYIDNRRADELDISIDPVTGDVRSTRI